MEIRRPPRIEFPAAVYHVITRGNNRQRVFTDVHGFWLPRSVIVRGNQRRQTFLGTETPIWKGSADIGTKIKDEKVEDKRRVGKTSGGSQENDEREELQCNPIF